MLPLSGALGIDDSLIWQSFMLRFVRYTCCLDNTFVKSVESTNHPSGRGRCWFRAWLAASCLAPMRNNTKLG